MNKSTKIGATIGPACDSVGVLVNMAKSGMNFARLNFSHGNHDSHKKLINNIRLAEKKSGIPIAIMGDIRGPRIRLNGFEDSCIHVKTGQELDFVINQTKTKKNSKIIALQKISIDAPSNLLKFLKINHTILIDDGRVEVKILKMNKNGFKAKVVEGGKLCEHKGLNFPDSTLSIPPISEKDKLDLEFCVKNGVEFIAMSFVKTANDIKNIKELIKKLEIKHKIYPVKQKKAKNNKVNDFQPIQIIAKIERHEAVKNIDKILVEADGIMVARGDLGLELKPSQVPLAQKTLIDKANEAAKPVIVATQMLDSMQNNRRPTRAEVSDVANAVIDHADALLLTNETAVGKHPVLVVKTMTDIIKTTEESEYDDKNLVPEIKINETIDQSISEVSRLLAENVGAKLILATSLTGETGRLISHVRPQVPIMVATSNKKTLRQINLSWGVEPFILPKCKSLEELVKKSVEYIKRKKIAKKGDRMIMVAGEPVGRAGNVNLVEVREI